MARLDELYNLTYVDKDTDTIDEWREKFNKLRANIQELIYRQGYVDENGNAYTLDARNDDPEAVTGFVDEEGNEDTDMVVLPQAQNVIDAFNYTDEANNKNELNATDAAEIENSDFENFDNVVAFINDTRSDLITLAGNLDDLNTDETASFVASINWMVNQVDLTNGLSTFDEETFVGKLNKLSSEVGDFENIQTDIGMIVSSINMMLVKLGDDGIFDRLLTPQKDTMINSINSLFDLISDAFVSRDEVRLMFDGFDEDGADTLIEKLNVAAKAIGDLQALKTLEKATIVGAINEIHDEVGDRTTLDTLKKDTIVDALNEKHTWKIKNIGKDDEFITYDDDVHILNTGTVLTIDEEYDYWVKEGHREQYNVWVKSKEKRTYKKWTARGHWHYWKTQGKKTGYYKTTTKKVSSGYWTTTKVAAGHWYTWRNYYLHNRLWWGNWWWKFRFAHHPYYGRVCLTPAQFSAKHTKWWWNHRRNGWTGPLGWGGWGWNRHIRHWIGVQKGGACKWTYQRKWVDTSKYITSRQWIDTTQYTTNKKWVDTSYWAVTTKTVDTSHWESRTKWVDTSHWEKRIRQVPMPDLPEIGLYLDGNVQATNFKYGLPDPRDGVSWYDVPTDIKKKRLAQRHDLEGNVVGDVKGYVHGNVSGTSTNWTQPIGFNLSGDITGGIVLNGTTDKDINISNQLPFSAESHDHDASNRYWKIGTVRDTVYLSRTDNVSDQNSLWTWVNSVYTVSNIEVGGLIVVTAGSWHHLWMNTRQGWFFVSKNYGNTNVYST